MPDFAYIARDSAGQRVTGTLSASSERDVLSALAGKALFPVSVAVDREPTAGVFNRRIKPQTMATVYGQLAGLMRSGVPLLRSLAVIRDHATHPAVKETFTQVYAKVEEGTSLADAMARHPKAFGDMAINMVRAGGEGGFLEDALDRVATFTEYQEDLKSRVTGALAYPVVLASIGTIVVTILIVFFVPMFDTLFETLREKNQMPWMTEMLLEVSAVVGSWKALVLMFALLFAFAMLRVKLSTPAGKDALDRIKLRLPIVGPMMKNMAVARFCRVLGTLLKNGVPILRSLQISGEATGNRVLAEAVQTAAENISSGQTLAAPLAACGHFPPDVVERVTVAEESNSLESVLVDVADSLDRRTWRQLDLFVRLLEPAMLVCMAGVVLMIAISLVMPMLRMSQAL